MWYTDAIYDGTKCLESHTTLGISDLGLFSLFIHSIICFEQSPNYGQNAIAVKGPIGTVKDTDKKTIPKSWERIWSLVDYQVFVAFSRGLLSQNIQTGLVLTIKL